MSDIITFMLPEDQYDTNIPYYSNMPFSLQSYNVKDPMQYIHYGGPENTLMLCGQESDKIPLNKVEIDNKNNVIKMELQAKDKLQSEAIKRSAAKLGFEVS